MENQIASNYKDASCVAISWRKQERFRYTRERYFEMKFLNSISIWKQRGASR